MTEVFLKDKSAPQAAQRMTIIDCDVHPIVKGGMPSLYPYMPQAWQQRFKMKGAGMAQVAPLTLRFDHPSGSALRLDITAPDGSPAGSDCDHVKSDLLDQHGIDYGILNCLQPGAMAAALATPEESVALCSAFNDYFLDTWRLTGSGPLRLAISVPVQDPDASVAEIRRLGRNPAVAAISLPLINIRMGNRHYYPIYEEAQRQGLPIILHVTGTESIYHGAPQTAVGWPENYVERYMGFSQIAESNIASLIFTGTFRRFPELKLLFIEYGFSWLTPLLWKMDRMWRSLRFDTPWVDKSPIDYVHEHIRLSTQPLDEPRRPQDLGDIIKMFGYDLLCFSSDYPHWDNDMPMDTLNMLPDDARRMIFSENARKFLRL